jgi:hypothetical protein
MADHCRKQIRDALLAGLSAMVTVKIVMAGRALPLDPSDLPAVLIFTNEETIANANKDEDNQRVISLTVEVHAQTAGLINFLDAVALELEPLIAPSLPAWVKDVQLLGTLIEFTDDAVETAGFMRLDYMVEYYANQAAPDVPL